MPQERGHREGSGQHHPAPDPGPGQHSTHRPAQQRRDPDERQTLGEQRSGRRGHVGDLVAGQADHRHRVGTAGHREHQPDCPDAEQTPGDRSGQRAVTPGEAALVQREPDEQEVEIADDPHPEPEAHDVDEHRERDEDQQRAQPPALMPPVCRGRERRDPQVDPDEPQQLRHHDERRRHESAVASRAPRPPQQMSGETEEQPHSEEHEGGTQQARGPAAQERGIRAGAGNALAGHRLERVGVRDAADEEEHRHDLQQPGRRLQRRDELERVGDLALGRHRDHEPVPEHDDQQRPDPQGVGPSVTVGCGGRGDRVGAAWVGRVHGGQASDPRGHPARPRRPAGRCMP